MSEEKFSLCIFPDGTCKGVTLPGSSQFDATSFNSQYHFPGHKLYIVTPSWVEALPSAGVLVLPPEIITNIPEYRLQFFPENYPPYLLCIHPQVLEDRVELHPLYIALASNNDITLQILLDSFQTLFPMDFSTLEFKITPENENFSISTPLMEQRYILVRSKVTLNVTAPPKTCATARKRTEILKEIYNTELTYVKDMIAVSTHFTEQFFVDNGVSVDVFRRTIKSVAEIYPTHQNFLAAMRPLGHVLESSIGSTFLEFIPYFKATSFHVANYATANQEITDLLKRNPTFRASVQQKCASFFDERTIESILVTPVQRIPRYPLLLRDLLKSTSSKHWDYDDLTKANTEITSVLKSMDERKRGQDELNLVVQLQQKFGNNYNVMSSGRKGLGQLENVKVNNDFKASFYLFNDILLCVRPLPFQKFIEFAIDSFKAYAFDSHIYIGNNIKLQETPESTEFLQKLKLAQKNKILALSSFGLAFIWRPVESEIQPPSLQGSQMVNLGNVLYLFGGYTNNKKCINDLWKFENNQWSKVHPMNPPAPRFDHTLCANDNKLYLFGGQNWEKCFGDLVIYDIETNKWTLFDAPNAPCPRHGHTSDVLDSQLWLFGGMNTKQEVMSDLYVFDCTSAQWFLLEADTCPTPRAWSTAFWLDDTFGIFGGAGQNMDAMNDIWTFNYDECNWTKMIVQGPLPEPRFKHTSVFFKNSLFVVGGQDINTTQLNVHQLDLTIDPPKWCKLPEFDEPPHFINGTATEIPNYGLALYGGPISQLYTINLIPGQNNDATEPILLVKQPNPEKFNIISKPIWNEKTKTSTTTYNCSKSTFCFDCKISDAELRKNLFKEDGSFNFSSIRMLSDINKKTDIYKTLSNSVNLADMDFEFVDDLPVNASDPAPSAPIVHKEAPLSAPASTPQRTNTDTTTKKNWFSLFKFGKRKSQSDVSTSKSDDNDSSKSSERKLTPSARSQTIGTPDDSDLPLTQLDSPLI